MEQSIGATDEAQEEVQNIEHEHGGLHSAMQGVQAPIDSASSETDRGLDCKYVRDLSYEAHRKIYELLAPPSLGRDWKTLADKMGYTYQQIRYFECCGERAVEKLITDYEMQGKIVAEFLSLLEDMERKDLIQDLEEYIAKMSTQEEIEKRQKRIIKMEEMKTSSESYDAFVCYAKPDWEFAIKIVKTLEGAPYFLKVCIDYRDFLPGCSYVDIVADAIAKRCKKVLVILSENFNKCEAADHQAKIALSLSPGAKEARLIPILYTPCVIPLTMRFIYHLDYTRDDFRMYFWDKLAEALGYTKKIEQPVVPDKQVEPADEKSAATNKMPDAAHRKVAGTHKLAAATNHTSATTSKKSSPITKQSAATNGQPAATGKQPAVTDMPSSATNQQSAVTNKRSSGIKKQSVSTGKKTAATAGKRTWLPKIFQRSSV